MDFKEYQANCLRTEVVHPNDKEIKYQLLTEVLEQIAVNGELLDCLKREIFYGLPFDADRWQKLRTKLKTPTDVPELYKLSSKPDLNLRTLHAVVGIATEAAELADALSKIITAGAATEDASLNIAEEAGDISYYSAVLLDSEKLEVGGVRRGNIAKLKARFADKFTQDQAENRDISTELEMLKKGLAALPPLPAGFELTPDKMVLSGNIMSYAAAELLYTDYTTKLLEEGTALDALNKRPVALELVVATEKNNPPALRHLGLVHLEIIYVRKDQTRFSAGFFASELGGVVEDDILVHQFNRCSALEVAYSVAPEAVAVEGCV